MQTAPKPIDLPSVQRQLGQLQAGVSDIVARERELIKNRAERLVVVRREMIQRHEADEEKHTQRIHELAAERQQAIAREEAHFALRISKIQQAYHASRSASADRAQSVKDRQLGQLQGALMRAREARMLELAEVKSAHQAFLEQLTSDRAARHSVRKSVLKALKSYAPVIAKHFDGRLAPPTQEVLTGSPEQLRQQSLTHLESAREAAAAAQKLPLATLFRWLPLSILVVILASGLLWYATRPGGGGLPAALLIIAIAEVILLGVWLTGFVNARPTIRRAAESLAAAKAFEIAAEKESTRQLQALADEVKNEQSEEGHSLSATFRESEAEWKARIAEGQKKLDRQLARLPAKEQKLHQRRLAKIEAAHEISLKQAQDEAADRLRNAESAKARINDTIQADVDVKIRALAQPWQDEVLPFFHALNDLEKTSTADFPSWSEETCATWTAPLEAPPAVRVGHCVVSAGTLPHAPELKLPDQGAFKVPFALGFPETASILIESEGSGGPATQALNSISLRLLASLPPGRASFVFIDPVGLGKDFAGLMHLTDYEETLIHHRIWTQSTQIEERLAELNDHIEKVIQIYLRNEYATITDYNAQAGAVPEKYRFLVIAGFPNAFSDAACKRLRSIASSGARCGVHLLMQQDTHQPPCEAALQTELTRACLRLTLENGIFTLVGAPAGAEQVVFDAPPAPDDAITLVHRIGKASIDSNRVQVPFASIAPPVDEVWSSDTTDELRVPIGRTGAKKFQMLAIGKGTRQHALVAGKTGSGKSTLFHVIITNLALWCSPEQVEFYLVDFKKGVEFKCYAARKLPHARVIAIESDREFALSVLQRLDSELKRRGELFRRVGSQDLASYKRSPGHEVLPRSLLLIDEFQEFFTEDDAVAQEASLLLDRIVRQGRAFGIHVILGSQTLGGAYTLARATLGQMVIRVALQCNETDAHLIMDDDNPAPRLLTRPGEGIYNDQAGALAANSPFQIVWLPEEERDALLDGVQQRAAREGTTLPGPIIFEGNSPADVRDNAELASARKSPPTTLPTAARAWLGAPNSIKGPTAALFRRQSGSHLLAVGQSAERTLSLLLISAASLAAEFPAGRAKFFIVDPHAAPPFKSLAARMPQEIRHIGPSEVAGVMTELAAELQARETDPSAEAAEIFVIVHDLQRLKSLRPDDEFRFSSDPDTGPSPAQAFANLLTEGGPAGIHVLASIDTWNNVSRWIPRKLLAEFEMRVLFQMSANDSSNLIDSAAAASLGLHRALFHQENLGTLETFRPYAMPVEGWI
jgi:DNA segregation ATPase FtsK/SpoIIIE, S-DNA-T family